MFLAGVFVPLVSAGFIFASIAEYALLSHTIVVLTVSLAGIVFLVFWGARAPVPAAILSVAVTLIAFAGLLFTADQTYKEMICSVAAEQNLESVKVHSVARYLTRDAQRSFPYPEGLGPLAAGKKGNTLYSWDKDQRRFKVLNTSKYYQFKERPSMSGC